jgi:thiol-disulfide isomerase/thioredoxin
MNRRALGMVVLVLLLAGCGGTLGTKSESVEVGWLPRSVLDEPGNHPFKARYDTVAVDQNLEGLIRGTNAGTNFLVFFGTWCSDSRREVPHFLKIADDCSIDSSRIHLYGLDRSKKSKDGLTDKYHIDRVPTFIFLKDGNEVGRITEKPTGSLEADMLAILAGAQQK